MNQSNESKKFKPFEETYRYCSLALGLSLLYPNMDNRKQRLYIMLFIVLISSVILAWLFIYTAKCFIAMDVLNTARNFTLLVLILVFLFKFFYALYKTEQFSILIEKISAGLKIANQMDEGSQNIVNVYIRKAKFIEKLWIFIPLLLTAQFPLYAALKNAYYTLLTDDRDKYMVHDMEMLGIEDIQYNSPYFEFIFVLNTIQSIIIGISFIGFDGLFCILAIHLLMKLKLIGHEIIYLFQYSKNVKELKFKLKDVIQDHQEAITFFADMQSFYSGWLFMVFSITSVVISLNLYSIYLEQKFSPKYAIFAISATIHMLSPCYFSTQIVKANEDLAVTFYSVDFEKWHDVEVTKNLIIMIQRAQRPALLTGLGIVYFDMRLFVSMMQFSYSFFTLITN